MALKPGNTSYRHQIILEKRHPKMSVGESYRARQEYEKRRMEAEATSSSFLGKIRDFFLGPKLPNLHEFASNANYVGGAKTITQYHKELEQGVKSGDPASDEELLKILGQIENDPNA